MSVEGSTHFIPRINTARAVEITAVVAPIAIFAARRFTHEPQRITQDRQRLAEEQRKIDQEQLETLRSNLNSGDFGLPKQYLENPTPA